MAISSKSDGSVSATTSETNLLNTTDLGAYSLIINLSPMTNGDRYRLRQYMKVRSADTEKVIYDAVFEHAQGQPVIQIPATPCPVGTRYTVQKEAGTNRSFHWNAIRCDA